MPWYRACVDLDVSGHPIGCSVELRDYDGVMHRLDVGPQPGPFDTIADVLASIADKLPRQLRLW